MDEEEHVFDEVKRLFHAIAGGRRRIELPDFLRHFRRGALALEPEPPTSAVDRSRARVLVLEAGFGRAGNTGRSAVLEQAGYQLRWASLAPAELGVSGAPTAPQLEGIREQIADFQPDVVVAAAAGTACVAALWGAGCWAGPTVLVDVHPSCRRACRRGSPSCWRAARAGGRTRRRRRSWRPCWPRAPGATASCTARPPPERGCWRRRASRGAPAARRTPCASTIACRASSMRRCAPRGPRCTCSAAGAPSSAASAARRSGSWGTAPSACAAGGARQAAGAWTTRNCSECRPRATSFASWRRPSGPRRARRRAAATARRRGVGQGQGHGGAPRRERGGVRAEHEALPRVRAQVLGGPGYRVRAGDPHVLGIPRSGRGHHPDHRQRSYHRAPLAASGTSGGSAPWGSGTYFARDARRAVAGGLCPRAADGTRSVLLCLLTTGVPCLGDPQHRGVLPMRHSPHRYNCAVDSLSSPETYVLQHPGAAHAAYLITFAPEGSPAEPAGP
ncbi:unnamed protein product [Prorocentrum cordatum]|uniref:Poly [ADP-ribose] polymerase n=1 Tax=Prorocentrum cordatum TaxID=2364126 RepID=A0ABN9W309_9DINO|nr:unnamed protein product [Polarella glacialis]